MTAASRPQAVRLAVLGATGSIGRQTLEILERHPQRFTVIALSAQSDWRGLLEPCRRWRPRWVVLESADSAESLRQSLAADGIDGVSVLSGKEQLASIAAEDEVEAVVAAVAGFAGAEPVLRAAEAGKAILLANKESVVVAGHLLRSFLEKGSACILPIDSEHNAIFQCLADPQWRVGMPLPSGVSRLALTASGGPFLGRESEELEAVTPAQACRHPNWEMGRKISVDSATMANKALELIECSFLFDCPHGLIDILIHPQSIVHALVMHSDGSVTAQLSESDMRVALAYALVRSLQLLRGAEMPARLDSGARVPDWLQRGQLSLEPIDERRWPIVACARRALDEGAAALVCFNAINEELVGLFLEGRIAFPRIASALEGLMGDCPKREVPDWAAVCEQDRLARECCHAHFAAAP